MRKNTRSDAPRQTATCATSSPPSRYAAELLSRSRLYDGNGGVRNSSTSERMTELARNTLRVVSLTLCLALSACAHFQQRTASQILADRQYSWIGDSTAHTRIHYLAGSPAADSLPRLRRDLESAWVTASDFVGDATQHRAIDVFAVPRREMVGAVAGMSITTNALNFWETRVVVAWVPARGWPGPHEFVHIMAYDAWGPAKEWWLGEGTAVAAGPWLGVDVDMYAKCQRVAGKQ